MLDALHMRHLQPSRSIELFFDAVGRPDAFASTTQEQVYDTIVLEHSAYVQHVSCSAHDIHITFDSAGAADVARNWPSTALVLITNHRGCNSKNERGVYMVKGEWRWAREHALQVTAPVERIKWEDATSTLELTYGIKDHDTTETVANLHKKRELQECQVTRKHRRFCGGAICGRQGVVTDPHLLWRTAAASRGNATACAKACLADSNCAAFNFHKKTGFCSAFGKSVGVMGFSREDSELYFHDRECWEARGQCDL
jgi:hypothetical protein